jgi:ABC-2 type transport system permease protein
VFALELPINGSLALLGFESILFTLVSLSLGLLISARAASQQTAMFISLVALFLPTIMLSGFMFPVENMHCRCALFLISCLQNGITVL